MIYKIYAAISFVLIQIVSIGLIQEINELKITIILYLCLTILNLSVIYYVKHKEENNV